VTQYLVKCTNCGGMVSQLEQVSTVDRCSACKDLPQPKKATK